VNVLAVSAANAGPGVVAFLVVAAIGVALFFLIKSMNRNLNKIDLPHEADVRKAEQEERRAAREAAARKRAAEKADGASGEPGDSGDSGDSTGDSTGPHGEGGGEGTAGDRPKKTNGAPSA
jgi:hypothetical protein